MFSIITESRSSNLKFTQTIQNGKYLPNSSTVNLAIRKILNVGMAILPLFIFYVIHIDVVYPNPKSTNKNNLLLFSM